MPAGYLMWPGVLQVISLMMLHRRRCGIILFAAAAVPYLPPLPPLSVRARFLMIIYAKYICACLPLCVCVCVCSLQSRFSILMQLCQFWRRCPPLPYPLPSIWLACWLVLYGTSRMVCVCVCACVLVCVCGPIYTISLWLVAVASAAAAAATNWQLIAASNVYPSPLYSSLH